MKKKIYGICKICGKEDKLTFEHIPPKSSGNNIKVRIYDEKVFDNPKRFKAEEQRGFGDYYTCATCNNYGGNKLIPSYNKVLNLVNDLLMKSVNEDMLDFDIDYLDFLLFIKQLIFMMCCNLDDIIVDKFRLGKFVLSQDDETLMKGLNIEIYIYNNRIGNIRKFEPRYVLNGTKKEYIHVSEVAIKPFGIIINYRHDLRLGYGLDINSFLSVNSKKIRVDLPVHETTFCYEYPLLNDLPISKIINSK